MGKIWLPSVSWAVFRVSQTREPYRVQVKYTWYLDIGFEIWACTINLTILPRIQCNISFDCEWKSSELSCKFEMTVLNLKCFQIWMQILLNLNCKFHWMLLNWFLSLKVYLSMLHVKIFVKWWLLIQSLPCIILILKNAISHCIKRCKNLCSAKLKIYFLPNFRKIEKTKISLHFISDLQLPHFFVKQKKK